MTPGGTAVVFTDLDGSLLDEDTYRWDEAREALDLLRRRGIPLVLSSSKTRAEMEEIAGAIGLDSPLIVENGGAVVVPLSHLPPLPGARHEGEAWVLALGRPRRELVVALAEIAAATGAQPLGFSGMTADELAGLTGLPPATAALALAREYDEPFTLAEPERAEALSAAAQERGLTVTRGGRFFHLLGGTDKGRAVRVLLDAHAAAGHEVVSVALGDSANDLPMLRAVDRAILIPRPGGTVDPALEQSLPHARRAPAPGPRGWNTAVREIILEMSN